MGHSTGILWTQETVDQLRALKAEGKTSREIASAMGLTITTVNKAWQRYRMDVPVKPIIQPPPAEPGAPTRVISLETIIERYDIKAAVLREVAKIPRGEFMEQTDLARLAAGSDHGRFNRCVEMHADEFTPYRIKIKLGERAEGRFFWGHPQDILKARAKVEEYL